MKLPTIFHDTSTQWLLRPCLGCAHFDGKGHRTCRAFPDEIPEGIWSGQNQHETAFPGDNGIQFEPAQTVRDAEQMSDEEADAFLADGEL